jgi:hypothetical protein
MPEKSAIGKVLWAPANRLLVARLAVLTLGVGLVVLLYALGFPNVGAACILAGLYVIVFSLLRSGAFSTTWLERHTPLSARRAMRLELAKALICAGIGVDGLFAFVHDWRYVPRNDLTDILLVTWLLLVVIGVCLFLARSFAAYLVSIRR